MAMYLEHLSYFMTAYQMRDIQEASRVIPMTKQGVQKAIRKLEDELGVPLFERSEGAGALEPTPYAHRLYSFATDLNSSMKLLTDDLAKIREQNRETVRVAMALGMPQLLGHDFWDDFKELYPHVDILVSEKVDSVVDAELADGLCDLALNTGPFPEWMETKQIGTVPVHLWVSADDPLCREGSVTIEMLANRVVTTFTKDGKATRCFEDRCRELGKWPKQTMYCAVPHMSFDTVLEGGGCAMTPEVVAANPRFQDEHVRSLPIVDLVSDIRVCRKKDRAASDAERHMFDYIAKRRKAIIRAAAPISYNA